MVNYTGTCDGKPITDTAPTAKGLAEQKNFWVDIGPETFLPGFADQLIGAKAGDKRAVNVDFPADFVTKELAGKKGVFEVEVVEVKEKVLPPVDDAFAKKYDAENLEKLRAGVRRDLENELKYSQAKAIRSQIIRGLLDRVNFDLPETAVAQETRNVVYDIVRRKHQRGVTREMIEQQKDEIYSAATHNAKERVKLSFLIQRIAEKEKHQGVAGGSFETRAVAGDDVSDSARQIPQGFAEAQRRARALRANPAREGAGPAGEKRDH